MCLQYFINRGAIITTSEGIFYTYLFMYCLSGPKSLDLKGAMQMKVKENE